MRTPDLETPRAALRRVQAADAPALQRHFANWNIIRQIGTDVPWPYPTDGAARFIAHMDNVCATEEVYFWGIFLTSVPTELVGAIECRFIDGDDDNRGFWLAEPYWGQGIMTEAIAATQDYLFETLAKPRLVVSTRVDNRASLAVKERTGWRRIGGRMGAYHDGPRLQEIWEITPASWAEARSKHFTREGRLIKA